MCRSIFGAVANVFLIFDFFYRLFDDIIFLLEIGVNIKKIDVITTKEFYTRPWIYPSLQFQIWIYTRTMDVVNVLHRK